VLISGEPASASRGSRQPSPSTSKPSRTRACAISARRTFTAGLPASDTFSTFDIGGDMEGRLVLHPEFSHGLLEFCTVPLRERASPAGRELGRSAPSARPEGDTRQMVQIGDLGNPQPPRGIHGSWQNQQSFFCQQRAHHFRQQSKRRALGTWPLNKRRS